MAETFLGHDLQRWHDLLNLGMLPLRCQIVEARPALADAIEGRMYFVTGTDQLWLRGATQWVDMSSAVAGGLIVHTHEDNTEGGTISYNNLTDKPTILGDHGHTAPGDGGTISYDDLTDKPTGARTFRTVTGDGNVLVTDDIILADCSSNDITLTLPLVTARIGLPFYIIRLDNTGNVLTLNGGGALISGYTEINIANQYTALEFIANGTMWFLI